MSRSLSIFTIVALFGGLTAPAFSQVSPFSGGLIINEYNAVSDTKTLTVDPTKPYKGKDSFFGNQLMGNGGNWVELVVTQDHLNVQGWSLSWTNADPPPSNAGEFSFNNNPVWSDLCAGTIITVRETDIGNPNGWDINHPVGTPGSIVASDTSFAPDHSDWWININEEDPTYITQTGFKVDNDNWAGTILDSHNRTVFGPIGESSPGWGGGGISSTEAGVNMSDPSNSNTNADLEDNDYTTFGSPNVTNQDTVTQDFSALRTWYTRTDRIPGDANLDRHVDIQDLYIMAENFGLSGRTWMEGDFDGNGIVNAHDLALLGQYWQSSVLPGETFAQAEAQAFAEVPEPASLSLLLLPVLILRRRGHCQ